MFIIHYQHWIKLVSPSFARVWNPISHLSQVCNWLLIQFFVGLSFTIQTHFIPDCLNNVQHFTLFCMESYAGCLILLFIMFYIQTYLAPKGHRIQHEIPFLWEHCHKVHHTLDSPTPVGTLYIDAIDATLQGGLPMMLAMLIVRPDLFTTYLYIALRVGENAVNHSGIDNPIINFITLKSFPFRASVAHHDSHHKFR